MEKLIIIFIMIQCVYWFAFYRGYNQGKINIINKNDNRIK